MADQVNYEELARNAIKLADEKFEECYQRIYSALTHTSTDCFYASGQLSISLLALETEGCMDLPNIDLERMIENYRRDATSMRKTLETCSRLLYEGIAESSKARILLEKSSDRAWEILQPALIIVEEKKNRLMNDPGLGIGRLAQHVAIFVPDPDFIAARFKTAVGPDLSKAEVYSVDISPATKDTVLMVDKRTRLVKLEFVDNGWHFYSNAGDAALEELRVKKERNYETYIRLRPGFKSGRVGFYSIPIDGKCVRFDVIVEERQ